MASDPVLDQLSREELIVRARALGARRPEVMTRVELRDEIVRLGEEDPQVRRRSRGWLGVARDLVASVVDSGLNLPGAAAAIRGEGKPEHDWQGPPPVATLTLAEIYLAQGHTDRALAVLAEVLDSEPDHGAALALRERIERRGEPHRVGASVPMTPETEDLTPGRAVSISAAVAAEQSADASGTEGAPGSAPASAPAPFVASVPKEPSASAEEPPPNPFPDEPSPLTSERAPPRHSEHAPFAEEQTVRALSNLSPERAACAVIATARGVEAFYELPASASDAVLRVVWFTPAEGGVERGELDLPVKPGYHRVPVEGLGARSEVRAALGVPSSAGFVPLAVAWVYRSGAGAAILAFSPPGEEPPTLRARVDARVVAVG